MTYNEIERQALWARWAFDWCPRERLYDADFMPEAGDDTRLDPVTGKLPAKHKWLLNIHR